MANVEDREEPGVLSSHSGSRGDKMFSLKKWNTVAMWSWDVECDMWAICRGQVMDDCPRCQAKNKQKDCVVVWGECNHSFHNCYMSLWVKQNNRCPLCQQDCGPKNRQMRIERSFLNTVVRSPGLDESVTCSQVQVDEDS
ncbi:PREDICTED: RING-box protein 2-like [Chrysochloris asiatica]|uniref:RING-box protein 2-like n=1 Tax=Chrysochloris asiatica TaxID=185453 RepID=A0A9B0X1U5_CHRAS|nr:PREDICTED: RING-box protein 2-like [Chrysochloris asiatica]